MPTPTRLAAVEQREPYERPAIEVIELKGEEVLAVGCKTSSTLAVGGNPACGAGAGCVQVGS